MENIVSDEDVVIDIDGEALPSNVKIAMTDTSNGVSGIEDMLTLIGYNSEVESLTLEAEALDELLTKNLSFHETIEKANKEVQVDGVVTNETALILCKQYNDLIGLLEIDSPEITTESAISFKKEIVFLTRETGEGESWIKKLIRKFLELCKVIYYKVVEYGTKLGIAITRQEVVASNLASFISDNLDNFKVDKWEYMVPYADILGNFTILKDFNVSSIEKYIKFNNGGFRSDELVNLFMRCVEAKDMNRFKKLENIPIDYDIKSYFTRYNGVTAVPVDISGATGHCILSYDDDGKTILTRKKFNIVADSNMRNSLKTKGILSREDMVSTLRQISISVRENRNNINQIFEHIKGINKLVNSLNDNSGNKFITDVLQCGTVLVQSLSLSSRVGLFSNSFIIGIIGKMARVYKKQSKIKT